MLSSTSEIQSQIDEVQQAVLGLQDDVSKRTAASDTIMESTRQSVDVNAETIKALLSDIENRDHTVSESFTTKLSKIKDDVEASIKKINDEVCVL